MKVSARIDYACRALLELSLHWPSQYPLQVLEIAGRQKIPAKFLVHILIELKKMGLVQSIRGQRGGYVLARSPGEIRLSQIVASFSELRAPGKNIKSQLALRNTFDSVLQEIDAATTKILDKVNFEEICKKERSTSKIPMYTI